MNYSRLRKDSTAFRSRHLLAALFPWRRRTLAYWAALLSSWCAVLWVPLQATAQEFEEIPIPVAGDNLSGVWESEKGVEYRFQRGSDGQVTMTVVREPSLGTREFVGTFDALGFRVSTAVQSQLDLPPKVPKEVKRRIAEKIPDLKLSYSIVPTRDLEMELVQHFHHVQWDEEYDDLIGLMPNSGERRIRVRRSPSVDIAMDLDFDGDVDEEDDRFEIQHAGADGRVQPARSAVVIRDQENVYAAKIEPARRRRVVVQWREADRDEVVLERSSGNLLLFDAPEGGKPLAFQNNQMTVEPRALWLQGGARASGQVGDEFLRVREIRDPEPGKRQAHIDEIRITVIWVDLIGRIKGQMNTGKQYAPHQLIQERQGHLLLGVQQSAAASADSARMVRGIAEWRGTVWPRMVGGSFGVPMGRGIAGREVLANRRPTDAQQRAEVQFGFMFRRDLDFRTVIDGSLEMYATNGFISDDSLLELQDAVPDPLPNIGSVIVDNDGPGEPLAENPLRPGKRGSNSVHWRANFRQWVVFRAATGQSAERVSADIPWSVGLDFGRDLSDQAVFLWSRPNDGKESNEVFLGHNYQNMNMAPELRQPPKLSKVTSSHGPGVVRAGEEVELVMQGQNLTGRVAVHRPSSQVPDGDISKLSEPRPAGIWRRAGLPSQRPVLRYHVEKMVAGPKGNVHVPFSDGSKVTVTLVVDEPVGTQVGFSLSNLKGSSEVIGPFEVIAPTAAVDKEKK